MYVSLYRKWRPKTFSDVIGQQSIVTTLRNSIKSGKTAHAYLFTGTRGTGKTTCARILAKAVNCLSPKNGDPCNECEICKGIDDGSLIDIIEIDGASHNKVENAQDILSEVMYTPIKAKRKVYIIDEVHMLTTSAFNALLKTLEEPPEHVMFILATTEPNKVLQTISSRCQRFDFKRIPYMVIEERLERIASAENVQYERDALINIARRADGSMRDALSLMELCMSSSSDLTAESVDMSLGTVSREAIYSICRCISDGDIANALRQFEAIYDSGKSVSLLINELITLYRNLMISKCGERANDLIETTGDSMEEIGALSERYTMEEILYCLHILCDIYNSSGKSFLERVEFESCLIRLCDKGTDFSQSALLARVSDIERKISAGIHAAAEPYDNAGVCEADEDTPPWETGNKKADDPGSEIKAAAEVKKDMQCRDIPDDTDLQSKNGLDGIFDEVILRKKDKLSTIYAFLKDAKVNVDGAVVKVISHNPMLGTLAQMQKADQIISDALFEATGTRYSVRFDQDSDEIRSGDPLDDLI